MRFLDRIRYGGAPKTPQEADSLALRQLAGRGADLTKPRHIIHFVLFAEEEDARAAAEAIAEAIVDDDRRAAERDDRRVVRAGRRRIAPSARRPCAAFRSWFDGVAAAHGGEYDGWEAAAKP